MKRALVKKFSFTKMLQLTEDELAKIMANLQEYSNLIFDLQCYRTSFPNRALAAMPATGTKPYKRVFTYTSFSHSLLLFTVDNAVIANPPPFPVNYYVNDIDFAKQIPFPPFPMLCEPSVPPLDGYVVIPTFIGHSPNSISNQIISPNDSISCVSSSHGQEESVSSFFEDTESTPLGVDSRVSSFEDTESSPLAVGSRVSSSASTSRQSNTASLSIKEIIIDAFAKLDESSLEDEHFLIVQQFITDRPLDLNSISSKDSPETKWKRFAITVTRMSTNSKTIQATNYFAFYLQSNLSMNQLSLSRQDLIEKFGSPHDINTLNVAYVRGERISKFALAIGKANDISITCLKLHWSKIYKTSGAWEVWAKIMLELRSQNYIRY